MKIWLLRHAESEWNAAERWQGHGDPPLSEAGRIEAGNRASSLARRVSGDRPVAVFSSDLRRAVETAAFVTRSLGGQATLVSALRELDVGRWTGLRRKEIEAQDPELLVAFEAGKPDVRPGGGETRGEIRIRVRAAVETLAAAQPDSDLLLVVHLGVIRALVLGAEPENLELRVTNLEQVRQFAQGSDGNS